MLKIWIFYVFTCEWSKQNNKAATKKNPVKFLLWPSFNNLLKMAKKISLWSDDWQNVFIISSLVMEIKKYFLISSYKISNPCISS